MVAGDVTATAPSLSTKERTSLPGRPRRHPCYCPKRLVLDKRLRASLGESGRQVALRDYSAEHEVDAHQGLYSERLRRLWETPSPFCRLKTVAAPDQYRIRQVFALIDRCPGPPDLPFFVY